MPPPATISVIIATRNVGRYIAECLDSVVAQSRPPDEIVVVDAASTDDTIEIVARYPLATVVQQDGIGFARAWNQGLAASTGAYVAFIDGDDRWRPEKLSRQAALLDADPLLDGVIGRVKFFLEANEVPPPGWRERVLDGEPVASMPGLLLARRRLFDILGSWGADWRIASDIDWFVRLRDMGIPLGVVDAVLLDKRVHSHNLSLTTAGEKVYPTEVLKLLHASIQRKRQGVGR